jgi:hypothetical protein
MIRPTSLFVVAALLGSTVPARGEDFRVETTVSVGKLDFQFLTLFRGTTAFDFVLPDGEVSIYDFPRQRVILVNLAKQERTIVSLDDLRDFCELLKTRAKERGKDDFFATPEYEVDPEAELPLKSATSVLAYAAQGIAPPSQNEVSIYKDFCDQAAMLACMKPGGIPPFVRLRLNEGLMEDGLVPAQVRRAIMRRNLVRNKVETVTAKHRYNWTLSATDRERIASVTADMASYKTVPMNRYFEATPQVATKRSTSRE